MQQVDVAVVGGGFAGSAATAMLARAGMSVALIDPHRVYPPDFRCEKLDASQVCLLRKAGLADAVLPMTTRNTKVWVARAGRVVARKTTEQQDARYHDMVGAVRSAIPANATHIAAKAVAIETGIDRQAVTLSDGATVGARLVVLANGLNSALRKNLGMTCDVLSACHSISVGFDIRPLGRSAFAFPALTYFPQSTSERMAYCTFFPVGSSMRANLFVYRDPSDPWLRAMRRSPAEALRQIMPGLEAVVGPFEVTGDVKIRPIDLYSTGGLDQPGIVLAGDAFATSCPAAGTGLNKVLTDVERLCSFYVPDWLRTDGMPVAKIAAFYADETKRESDRMSLNRARRLRSLSTSTGPYWSAIRWTKRAAQVGVAALRRLRDRDGFDALQAPATATSGRGQSA